MNIKTGLAEIDNAKWVKDIYGSLNLDVTHEDGTNIHCFLSLRNHYCDRGHIQLNIDSGSIDLDHSDSFPRFFFSFEEADAHTRTFLKWRIWKHRIHPHELEINGNGNQEFNNGDSVQVENISLTLSGEIVHEWRDAFYYTHTVVYQDKGNEMEACHPGMRIRRPQ